MLFEILKALGLDVPGTINSLKADIDQRVEKTTAQLSVAAQQAAVLAALYTLAAVAVLLAIGVALVALCLRVTESYGVYAGLGLICGLLLAAAVLLGLIAAWRSKSLGRSGTDMRRPLDRAAHGALETGGLRAPAAAPAADAFTLPQAPPEGARPTAGDVVEPLALFLAKFLRNPGKGRPMAAEFFSGLSESEPGVAEEALESATNVLRYGNRTNLVAVLAGAAFVGFLMTRFSGQK
jgi:hypothetical protein